MKPYKDIQESKKVLKKLITEAKNSSSPVSKLKDLNIIIRSLNNYSEMLENKYYTEYFDILILSRLKQSLFSGSPSEELNLKIFETYLKQDLEQGRDFQIWNISDFIQTHQLINSLKKGFAFQDSKEDLKELIENNLLEIKKNIVWNKSIK